MNIEQLIVNGDLQVVEVPGFSEAMQAKVYALMAKDALKEIQENGGSPSVDTFKGGCGLTQEWIDYLTELPRYKAQKKSFRDFPIVRYISRNVNAGPGPSGAIPLGDLNFASSLPTGGQGLFLNWHGLGLAKKVANTSNPAATGVGPGSPSDFEKLAIFGDDVIGTAFGLQVPSNKEVFISTSYLGVDQSVLVATPTSVYRYGVFILWGGASITLKEGLNAIYRVEETAEDLFTEIPTDSHFSYKNTSGQIQLVVVEMIPSNGDKNAIGFVTGNPPETALVSVFNNGDKIFTPKPQKPNCSQAYYYSGFKGLGHELLDQ